MICAFQVICDPLSNCSWTPAKANTMIAAAWIISLFLCVPQVPTVKLAHVICLNHFHQTFIQSRTKISTVHFGAQDELIFALLFACSTIVEVANTDKWKSNHSLIPYIAPVMMVI